MEIVGPLINDIIVPLALGFFVWGALLVWIVGELRFKGLAVYLGLTAICCVAVSVLAIDAATGWAPNRGFPLAAMAVGIMTGTWATICLIFIFAARMLVRRAVADPGK